MTLRHDYTIDIATAHTRTSKKWRNRKWQWSELVSKCAETTRTDETVAEYTRMDTSEQSSIKDVGGFVGGYLTNGMRKNGCVMYRSCATLDIDYGTANVWDDFTMAFGFAAMLYSTHKHTPEKPRLRLVFPFSRPVTAAEYEPVCRRIAETLGLDLFDTTTYQLPRLFYWPSTSKDGEYVFEVQDGPACNPDEYLNSYVDYRDVSAWPIGSRESDVMIRDIKKAGDPTEKPGLIGAFCRTYTIEEAIEKFLADKYERTAHDGRYTYKQGSVAGGLVCYENHYAYSHHETDPASRQLCNAFDLCRIHLYGVQDEGSKVTDNTRLPSYLAMQDFVAKDGDTKALLFQERRASAHSDFADVDIEDEEEQENADWIKQMDCDKKGNAKSTAANIMLVLENDPKLKGHLWHDLFSGFDLVKGGLPWDKSATQWSGRDDANLRYYFDSVYGITGKDKIKDCKDALLTKYRVHPIRDYLNALVWDGVPRLERLIIDYIGAEDTPLNRAMTKKHFTAAVARIMEPGCKYDYCLIMTGAEGIGKSTLLGIMGGEWFNDSLTTTEGKEGMEQLRRSWIIELAELSSIRRSDVEQVKNYITRRDDIYRAAYGTVVEKHPRQCVFFGTTNETYFLKGDTGNRRFWIIDVNKDLRRCGNTAEALRADRDQLWAEAVQLYRDGELLYLPDALEQEARQKQVAYNDDVDDPMAEMLRLFLDTKLPSEWATYDLNRRRAYINNPDPLDEQGSVTRDRFCIAEFICERLKRSLADKEYKYLARKIGKLMDDIQGWEKISTTKHAMRLYGIQKGYRRTFQDEPDDDI